MCKLTNNDREIKDTVGSIRCGIDCTAKEIAEIKAAITHLCYMTENLNHKADVRFYLFWRIIYYLLSQHSPNYLQCFCSRYIEGIYL